MMDSESVSTNSGNSNNYNNNQLKRGYNDIRLVQHLSASCRFARIKTLNNTLICSLFDYINDYDVLYVEKQIIHLLN